MEPAALVTEPRGDQVDERGHVVTGLTLAGPHLGGARDTSRRTHRGGGSAGTTPTAAQPSSAASSTSSQRWSFASSDQILAISGRL